LHLLKPLFHLFRSLNKKLGREVILLQSFPLLGGALLLGTHTTRVVEGRPLHALFSHGSVLGRSHETMLDAVCPRSKEFSVRRMPDVLVQCFNCLYSFLYHRVLLARLSVIIRCGLYCSHFRVSLSPFVLKISRGYGVLSPKQGSRIHSALLYIN